MRRIVYELSLRVKGLNSNSSFERVTIGGEAYSPLLFGRGARGEGAKLGAKYF
jgi:hypothetical protein